MELRGPEPPPSLNVSVATNVLPQGLPGLKKAEEVHLTVKN